MTALTFIFLSLITTCVYVKQEAHALKKPALNVA